MPRRTFEEEAGLYDDLDLPGGADAFREQPLKGLPPPSLILIETGGALAAALGAGVFLLLLAQWTGLR
jgi:hypothetical protein